jgi:hypothetical protein
LLCCGVCSNHGAIYLLEARMGLTKSDDFFQFHAVFHDGISARRYLGESASKCYQANVNLQHKLLEAVQSFIWFGVFYPGSHGIQVHNSRGMRRKFQYCLYRMAKAELYDFPIEFRGQQAHPLRAQQVQLNQHLRNQCLCRRHVLHFHAKRLQFRERKGPRNSPC